MSKYIYKVILDVMEETYLKNAKSEMFANEEERSAFNAKLIIEATSEEQSIAIRKGMTDLRMWELDCIED